MFPPIEHYRTDMFAVDKLHTLYWEESGNPDGVPMVHVHGGPDDGASPEKRQWFDPAYFRIVLYDRRAMIDPCNSHMARRWYGYSQNCAMLRPDVATVAEAIRNDRVAYETGRFDSFYFRSKMFLEE